MTVRILHLADVHLGARCDSWGDRAAERQRDLQKVFERAIDRALDPAGPAHAVVIAGDLFDYHRPTAQVVSFAKGQLDRLAQASIPVLIVPGTHDSLEYPDSVFRDPMPAGVHVFTEPNISAPFTLELAGETVCFYGMAYVPGRSKPPFDVFKRTTDDAYHVAMIHGSLEGNPAWNVKERYVPLSLESLGQSGMHYVALGHYHEFRSCESNRVRVVYPGTLEGLTFDESGNRYLTWVELADGEATVQHMAAGEQPVNSKVLDVRTLDLGACGAEDVDALAELIQQWADPQLGLRLRLEGTAEFAIDADALQARLAPSFALLLVDDDAVRYYDSRVVEELAQDETVPGLFVRRLRERIDSASEPDARARAELALKLGVSEFLKE